MNTLATLEVSTTLLRLRAQYEQNRPMEAAPRLWQALRDGQLSAQSVLSWPDGDDWLDWIVLALKQHLSDRRGFVYVACNPAFTTLAYKVGQTSRAPEIRTAELTTAGVAGRFELLLSCEVPDRFSAEAQAHARLKAFTSDRELFAAPFAEVESAVLSAARQQTALLTELGL